MTVELDQAKAYYDFQSLGNLKSAAKGNSQEALEQTAQQFESLFVQMLMKSMRQANSVFSSDSFINNDKVSFYQDMHDQQLSVEISKGNGLGLAELLVEQLKGAAALNDTKK